MRHGIAQLQHAPQPLMLLAGDHRPGHQQPQDVGRVLALEHEALLRREQPQRRLGGGPGQQQRRLRMARAEMPSTSRRASPTSSALHGVAPGNSDSGLSSTSSNRQPGCSRTALASCCSSGSRQRSSRLDLDHDQRSSPLRASRSGRKSRERGSGNCSALGPDRDLVALVPVLSRRAPRIRCVGHDARRRLHHATTLWSGASSTTTCRNSPPRSNAANSSRPTRLDPQYPRRGRAFSS